MHQRNRPRSISMAADVKDMRPKRVEPQEQILARARGLVLVLNLIREAPERDSELPNSHGDRGLGHRAQIRPDLENAKPRIKASWCAHRGTSDS